MLGDGGSKRGAFDASVIVPWGELASSQLLAQSYGEASTRADILLHLFGVSWEELTSSKLQAQSYDEEGKCVLTTDYRTPTTNLRCDLEH